MSVNNFRLQDALLITLNFEPLKYGPDLALEQFPAFGVGQTPLTELPLAAQ